MIMTVTVKKSTFVVPHVFQSVLERLQLIVLGSLLLGVVMGTLRPEVSFLTFALSFLGLLCVATTGAYVQYSQRWEIWQQHLARRR